MQAEEVSVNIHPIENKLLLGVKAVDHADAGHVAIYELTPVQCAKLAMDAHTMEMSLRGVIRKSKRFHRLRAWLLCRL